MADAPLSAVGCVVAESSLQEDRHQSVATERGDREPVQAAVDDIRYMMRESPCGRLLYLDEYAIQVVGSRLMNDPEQFTSLKAMASNFNVKLDVINDASAIDASYFAHSIWSAYCNDTLVDIPSFSGMPIPGELYPGAVVRVRAFLENKEDLRPERMTLTAPGVRIHVEMTKRGILSANKSYLLGRGLYVVGQLKRLRPLSVVGAAVLL
jgi:hypothetical protein